MKFDPLGDTAALKQLSESVRAHSQDLEQVNSTRRAVDNLGLRSGIQEMIESQNRWKSDMASVLGPRLGLTDMFERFSLPAQLSAARIDELSSLKSFLPEFESSLGNSALSMLKEIEERNRSSTEGLKQAGILRSLGEAGTWATQSEQVRAILEGISAPTVTRMSFAPMVNDIVRGSERTAEIAASLRRSFELSQLVGTASIAAALERSMGALARQHSEQLSQIQDRLKNLVGPVPTFDFSTAALLAELHGVNGIARQLASLSLSPEQFLGEGAEATDGEETVVPTQTGWKAQRLDDLRDIVIGLIVNMIFQLYVSPYIANQDTEAINKRLDNIEKLVQTLPNLLAPQIEDIVRRELEADLVVFVVGSRAGELRLDPAAGSPVTAIVFPNQVLTLLDERGKWIKVEFYDYRAQDVRQGWILKKYCARQPKRTTERQKRQG